MKKAFFAGTTCQRRRCDRLLERLKELNADAWTWIDALGLEKWCMSHDRGCRYGHTNSNIAECVNSVLKAARRLPVAALVLHTFYNMVKYFDSRRSMYCAQMGDGKMFSAHCLGLVERRLKSAYTHQVTSFNRHDGVFEVITGYSHETRKGGNRQVVRLTHRCCTCGKFQATKIPCSHAIAACLASGVDYFMYVDGVYKITTILKCYRTNFQPLGHESYWPPMSSDDERCLIPDSDTQCKRGKLAGRRKNEMDITGSSSRAIQHCRKYRMSGHNRKTYPNAGP